MKTLKYLFTFLILFGSTILVQGQKLSLGIYPEPQEVIISSQVYTPIQGYTLSGIVNPDADAVKVLKETLPFVQKGKGFPIEIKKIKETAPGYQRSGAYVLNIKKKGITIEIVDDRSLFYAAQTIKQLAGSNANNQRTLPICTIKDYPDVAHRGTVEGFYGDPWTQEDRLEQLRFYGKLKLNTYIYGPKDDPYHRSPRWREPYPEDLAKHIRELVKESAHNKVDFIWALHPGMDIQWTVEDSYAVLTKLENMYDLGVRAFAIFFDDIEGEGAKADKQATLLNYIQKEFVNKKQDVQPLILCPTEYNRSWATTNYLDVLGTQLDSTIQVMWTGDRVIGDITKEGMEWVNKRIQRPAFVWWNFPVNDYCRDHLLMGEAYGLDTQIAPDIYGFVANPMERAEAAKVGIFSIAMYSWNMKSYNSQKAWEKACEYVMPEAAIAFRTFCEHNSDPGSNGHLYRRNESTRYAPLLKTFIEGYTSNQFREKEANQLNALFSQIATAPTLIYSQSPNKQLIQEINPWLIQFEFLGKTGTAALRMAKEWYEKDPATTWQCYQDVTALLDSMQKINRVFNRNGYQNGVKVGSKELMPFISELYRQTGYKLLHPNGAQPEETQTAVSSIFTNVEQIKNQPCRIEDNTVSYSPCFEIIKIKPGEFLGLGWEVQKEAQSFNFNLPNSNIEGRVLEWSTDGKNWTPFPDVPSTYAKEVIGDINPKASFVRMRNNSDKTMEIRLINFSITTKANPLVDDELMMYDMNLSTYKVLKPGEKIHIKCDDADFINLFLSGNNESLVSVTGIDKDGDTGILYQGNIGFIKLRKELFDNMKELELSTIGKDPIHIHQIIRE